MAPAGIAAKCENSDNEGEKAEGRDKRDPPASPVALRDASVTAVLLIPSHVLNPFVSKARPIARTGFLDRLCLGDQARRRRSARPAMPRSISSPEVGSGTAAYQPPAL